MNLRVSLALWQRRKKRYARLVRKWDRAINKAQRKKSGKAPEARERRRHWQRQLTKAEQLIARRKQQIDNREDERWGGSRQVTNEIIRIVNGRATVSSRKRWELFGNPSSDHHRSNKTADAVDFRIAEAHWLKNEISRRLGGPAQLVDYGEFNIVRNGHTFRVQIIAGTHGTGPHLHVGVRRVG